MPRRTEKAPDESLVGEQLPLFSQVRKKSRKEFQEEAKAKMQREIHLQHLKLADASGREAKGEGSE